MKQYIVVFMLVPMLLVLGLKETTASSLFQDQGQAVFNIASNKVKESSNGSSQNINANGASEPTNNSNTSLKQSENEKYYTVLYNYILRTAQSQGPDWANWMALTIIYYCNKYGVDPLLVAALFTQESGFALDAYSSTGALSIAQLMPDTARELGITPQEAWSDPEKNIAAGIKYVAYLLDRYRYAGDWCNTYAIAAYNAGPGAVVNGLPPYSETINHVYRVGEIFKELISEYESL